MAKKRGNANKCESNSVVEIELTPSDSVSQVSSCNSAASNSFVVAHRIELKRKRAELQSIKDVAKAHRLRLLVEADAEARKAKAKAGRGRDVGEITFRIDRSRG